jgi:hypothetical protein
MTFGGAPNPSQWSDVSEMATNLANDLVCHGRWDHTTQTSPHQHIPNEKVRWELDDVPITAASELAVDLMDDDWPKADCYIDDIFTTFLEYDIKRGSKIAPFVIHLLSCPVVVQETLPCEDLLSFLKFMAEATPPE